MKKILTLILLICTLLTAVGCKEQKNVTSEIEKTETVQKYKDFITLIYSASDTFNPYDAQTDSNRQLCRLIYEPLVKIDNEFKTKNSIAKKVTIKGKTCTVEINDIIFSDGTKLLADDVVYSYRLAKESSTYYAKKLYEVESVRAEGAHTVIFKLEKQDPYFENVLDFPILKAKSENIADSDSVKFPPIGSGRYKVSQDRKSLVQNKNYNGKKGSIKEIRLINAPDDESASHYLEIGAVDMYYTDLSDGNILRMSGQKIDINLNNLVYIGVNHNNSILKVDEIRQAISTALNREKICKDAYYNNALAATGFFNPVWEEVKSLQNIQTVTNSQITIENLEKIGYNGLDEDGIRRKKGSALRFSLLVNKENKMRVQAANLIAAQLKEYGIGITVVKTSYKDYKERLKDGNFQLYLGEVKITDNMDISSLVTKGGSAAYGITLKSEKEDKSQEESETKEKITYENILKGFYKGDNSISDVVSALQTDMPIIPLCYRTGVLFSNEKIENVKNSSAGDIYFSIESYKFNDK